MRRFSRKIINAEFTRYIIARVLFIGGLRMTTVLLGWRLYELTGSKFALGMLGLSEVIPAIALALPAGVRVDRSNKQRLLLTCMSVYFALMLALLLITSPWMLENTSVKTVEWSIYGIVFCTGLARAYSGAGFNSFLSQLVPRENLVRAVSINSMVWLIAAVIGPATSGILMGYTNITTAFVLVCVLVGTSVVVFSGIRPKPITWKPGNTRTWDSVKEGLRFVFRNKPLLGAMVLDMFAVLFGGAAALLPVFATDILAVGPVGLGWLVAATYMGNFIAIARLTIRPLRGKQGKILLYAVGGFGLSILVFALSGNFWLSFFALFTSGLFDGVSVIIRGTIVQLFVPDEMRGRVASVNSIFINSSNELGQFESGVTASVMGTVTSVVFGGCMTLIVVVSTWFKAPELRKFGY